MAPGLESAWIRAISMKVDDGKQWKMPYFEQSTNIVRITMVTQVWLKGVGGIC